MAKLYNEQTVTDVGEGVEAYKGNAGQVLMGLSKELDDYSKEQEKEYITSMNAYAQGMKNLTTQSMQDIYTQYQNDPNKLQEEFNKLDNELINNIPDEDLKLQFKSEFLLDSSTYINRSKNNLKRIQEAQLKQSREQSLIESMNLRDSALYNMMSGVADGDDASNFKRATYNIETMLKSKDAYGIYTFSPSQQESFRKGMDKSIADSFYSSMYDMGYDEIDETLQKLHKDNYTVSYFDDNGKKQEINLKDMVKPETYRDIKNKSFKVMEGVRKSEYFTAHSEFTQNPTQEGLDRLKQLDPKMSQKTEDNLLDILDSVPNYDAETSVDGIKIAKEGLGKLTSYIGGDNVDNAKFLDDVTGYIKTLTDLNKKDKAILSIDDVNAYSNLAYRMVNDKVFAEQVNSVYGKPGAFEKALGWVLPDDDMAKIEQIGLTATRDTINLLMQDRPEEAREVYKKAQQKAIQLKYKSIDFTNLKEGDTIWFEGINKAFKFMGYSLDDVLVEVDPQTGAVR
jgi:hypothetical protein